MTIQTVVHPDVAKWLAVNFADEFEVEGEADFGPCVAMGLVKDGKPVAAFVLTECRKMKYGADARVAFGAIEGSAWATRASMRAMFEFAFAGCGCTRLTSVVSERNTRAITLNKRAGFRKVGVVPRGYDGKTNAIVYSMLADQCPWYKPEKVHG